MKKKLKPRLGGRGKYGALQNFLSASYKRREDFSILKKFAYQTSNPTISRLAQICMSSNEFVPRVDIS